MTNRTTRDVAIVCVRGDTANQADMDAVVNAAGRQKNVLSKSAAAV